MLNIFGRFIILKKLVFFIIENLFIFGVVIFSISARFSFSTDLFVLLKDYFWRALVISVVFQLCLYYNDLYVMDKEIQGKKLILKLLQSLGVGCIILSVIYYIYSPVEIGRKNLLLSIIFLFIIFLALRLFYFQYTKMGSFKETVLIVGSGDLAKKVGEILHYNRELGFKVVGFIDDDPKKKGKTIVNPKVIGNYQDLSEIIKGENIRNVVVALPDRRGNLPLNELLKCKVRGTKVIDGISFYEQISGKIDLDELKPSWLIFSTGFKKPRSFKILKRFLDISLSVIGLILAFPIFIIVWIIIKLDSPGPFFYRQERVGENGCVFSLLKFRTMRVDAEATTGPVWAMKDDPRTTRIGKLLRRARIDEIPQMINVLRGEMSFVGPRPERFHFIQELQEKSPYYSLRHSVKPGITGWAQIKYKYGASIDDAFEKLQYDLYYIKNMSWVFDVMILFETIKIVIFGCGSR